METVLAAVDFMATGQLAEGPISTRSHQKIRTVFCTSGGVLGAVVMAAILTDGGFQVVGLVRSTRVFRPWMGFGRGAAHFFLRCGILYTVYIWLITTAAEAVGYVLDRTSCSVEAIARREGIRVFNTRDLNSPEGREFLRALDPCLLVSAHFDQKLDKELCDGFSYAAVNLHPSLLPEHRGVEPVFQSVLAQEREVGVTLHRLSEALDKGRILAQERVSRDQSESVFAIKMQLMKLGAEMLLKNRCMLLDLESGRAQAEGGSYESWPHAREVRELYRKGMKLIRWKDLSLF